MASADVDLSADEATKSGDEEKLDGIKQTLVKLYEKKKRLNHAAGLAVSQRRWSRVAESMGDMKLLWAKEKLKEFTFFQQLPGHVQSQLLDVVYYNKLSEGTPLFIQGDKPGIDDVGESYIVLSGEVSIWVAPSNKVVAQASPAARNPKRRVSHSSQASSTSLLSEDEADRVESDKDSLDNECEEEESWGNLVASVHSGTLLGHLALMRQQPRNATCVAAVDTEVLVLRKLDFMRILKDYVDVMKDSKAEFLSNHIPGLTKLPPAKSEYLLHNFEKTTFERDFVFYEQGEPSTEKAVYVLAKGSIEVSSNGHTVGVLVPGAVFGSLENGTVQAFTLSVAHQSSVELYEVRGKNVLKLPHSLRQDIATHIQHSHMWHKLRLKEAPLASSPPPKVANTPTGSQRGLMDINGRKNLPAASEAAGLWAFAEQSRMKEASWQTPVTLLQQPKGDSRPGSSASVSGPRRKLPARQAANLLTQQDFAQQGLKSSPSLPSLSRQGSSCSTCASGTDSQRIGTFSQSTSRASSTASSRATKARAHEVLRRLKQMD